MQEQKTCPQCGGPLPADAPAGNCPSCLVNIALAAPGPDPLVGSGEGGTRTFGDYELLERLGSGGMGVIYRARQISLNRLVALKMIRSGQFASPQEIARFKMEAEAVGSLDHPNLVPVFEVGELQGDQYLSMKLVAGRSLEQEKRRYQQDPRAMAVLLAKVARAVHHAHQRGILHRDLKPSNIIIDEAGEPQVTDFGLAKRLGQDQGMTLTGQMVGTPAYMAPEQARAGARALTTAADVYSLGVILYELLTGDVPFKGETPMETLRQAAEQEPKPPSSVRGRLDRDLETICLRCLEKEPGRRYASAEALAEELERWLRHEPILARRSGVWSRSVKWVRRHPASAAVIAVLLLGSAASWWSAVRATRAKEVAESAAIKAGLIIDFLDGMSAAVVPGRDMKKLPDELDQTARRLISTVINQPEVDAEFRSVIGKFQMALGELDRAEAWAREALAMKRKLLGSAHPDVANSLNNLTVVLQKQSKLAEAEGLAREALAMRRKLLRPRHPDVAASLEVLGEVLLDQGKPEEAEVVAREALAIKRKRLGAEHADVANLLNSLAVMLEKQSKLADAETMHREALALKRKLLGAENTDVASSLNNLGVVLEKQARLAEAETMHREALAMRRKLLGNDTREVGTSLNNLAVVLGKQGKLAETETALREALMIQRKLLGNEHPLLASSLYNLGWILAKQGKLAEAEPVFRESLAMGGKLLGDGHPNVAIWRSNLAQLLAEEGKLREAADLCSEGLDHSASNSVMRAGLLDLRGGVRARSELWAEAMGDFAESSRLEPARPVAWYSLATLTVKSGHWGGYRQHCQAMLEKFGSTTNLILTMRIAKASLLLPAPQGPDLSTPARLAEICATAGKGSTNEASFELVKGLADYRQGNYGQAADWTKNALKQSGIDNSRDMQACAVLAMAQQALGQTNEARASLAKAKEVADTKLPKLGSGDLGSGWQDWIISHTLLHEAQSLIEAPASAAGREGAEKK